MSSPEEGIHAITDEPANRPIVKRFIRFAVAVAVVPIVIYFAIFHLASSVSLPPHQLLSPPILAGFVAVFSINIITSLFAVFALNEKSPSSSSPSSASVVPSATDHSQHNTDSQGEQPSQTDVRQKTD